LKNGHLPNGQKWADFNFFIILNLKSKLSRGHFYVKNCLGPRLTQLVSTAQPTAQDCKIFKQQKKKLMLKFSAQSPVK
jgi:hypothetical protein